jgi:hypothetical protein
MPAACIDYPRAAILRTQGLNWKAIAPLVGAKNEKVLYATMSRKGLIKTLASHSELLTKKAEFAANTTLERLSGQSRKSAASVVDKHLAALDSVPAKPSLKHLRAVGEALEPLVRSADKVHGWSSQEEAGLLCINSTETLLVQAVDNQGQVELPGQPVALSDAPMLSSPSQPVDIGAEVTADK